MQYDARPLRSVRRLQNLKDNRPKWYRISNVTAGQPTHVSIYDEIGFYGVSAGDFLADLKAVPGDIELHLNSPGGDVFDGIAIFNQLKQRQGSVHVVVDGFAASAASFIAQAASPGKLEMSPHSQLMIHNGFAMAIGDAGDLRKTADLLDKITTEIASIYAERSGKPADHWLAQMSAETWYSDSEAVAAGLADKIHGEDAPSSEWDLSVFDRYAPVIENADKYSADDRKRMAGEGSAMPDGSYPIADAEDLDNAIHAVGRGGADHDAIRKHIITRAAALGLSSRIPDNWNSDGSMKDLSDAEIWAELVQKVQLNVAGKPADAIAG